MSDIIDDESESGREPSDSKRKYMIIGIVLALILAIAIPTYLTLHSKSSEPQVTLETLDTKIAAVETNLGGGIAEAKSDLAWVKEKVANLINDVDGLAGDLSGVASQLNAMGNDILSLKTVITTLSGVVNKLDAMILGVNATLAGCNCTCGGV